MTSDNPTHLGRQVFERIGRERMADLPILNEGLRVEVVGFVDWGDMRLGVLITPWCVNLMALPRPGCDWRPPDEGVWRYERFPGMEMQLLGGEEEGLGRYAFRSLLSPVTGYDDQRAVRAVAREVLKQLLTESGTTDGEGEATGRASTPRFDGDAQETSGVSRRRLLGGE
jgi:[NiFe] hydrogenase assembly HybE family chaperone